MCGEGEEGGGRGAGAFRAHQGRRRGAARAAGAPRAGRARGPGAAAGGRLPRIAQTGKNKPETPTPTPTLQVRDEYAAVWDAGRPAGAQGGGRDEAYAGYAAGQDG